MFKSASYFGNPAYLPKRDGQPVIDLQKEGDEGKTIPIEEISVVILNEQQITIALGLLFE